MMEVDPRLEMIYSLSPTYHNFFPRTTVLHSKVAKICKYKLNERPGIDLPFQRFILRITVFVFSGLSLE